MNNPLHLIDEALQLLKQQKRWRIINDLNLYDAEKSLQQDSLLLREVASGKRSATIRLWRNPQCLVATRKETKFPAFNDACEIMSKAGWPVLVRDSGGTCVPHQPGILNFTIIYPVYSDQKFDLDLTYVALCEPIRMALANYGLDAEYGATEGSYCDGRYNLNVSGLKITGTAQKIMVSPENNYGVTHAVMAQAMLMIAADAADLTAVVNRFYRLSGSERQFDQAVSTSVRQLLAETENHPQESLITEVSDALLGACKKIIVI